ncbi:MAG: substrate-binding domain-containing protein [Deltaproteobacteria bacterium]|nr:substrate-binding domain-containing protein [Deltaproteobacteria bacterium]
MRTALVVGLGLAVLSLCTVPARAEQTLTIPGTGASQVMLRALGEAFSKQRPDLKVDVPDSTGSGGGIKAVGEGKAELGRVARKIKEKEKGLGLTYLPFARVPVVFAAHPSVKLKGLTAAQSAAIFTGQVTSWKELGGPDKKIRVVTRAEGDSTLDALRANLKEWADLKVTPLSKATDTDGENADVLAATDGGAGYSVFDLAAKKGLTVFTLDGLTATNAAYPVQMVFGLVYKPEKLQGAAKEFVDFLFTPAAAKIIQGHGADPLRR